MNDDVALPLVYQHGISMKYIQKDVILKEYDYSSTNG